ncbi:MAG: sigma-70 family RNA polymerase sigma factor [candidate division WOR-3 bacterium]
MSERNGQNQNVGWSELNDTEVIRRFKAGDEKSFEILFRRYYEKIYQLAYRMTHNQDDALDLTQESFLRAYKNLKKFREESSFYTWLYRICLNLCYNYYKKNKSLKNVLPLDSEKENIDDKNLIEDSARGQLENTYRREYLSRKLSWAINKLPLRQRLIFLMRHFDDLNYEQIASKLKISVGGVKSNYHHAIHKLQKLLKGYLNEL